MNNNIIVCFNKPNDVNAIKTLISHYGYRVAYSCMSGARALEVSDKLGDGIIICGFRLNDMICIDLYDNKPDTFSVITVSSPKNWGIILPPSDMAVVDLPMKPSDMIATLEDVEAKIEYRKRMQRRKARLGSAGRSAEETELINKAKSMIMKSKNITEPEAYRYIQKLAMDSGISITETASKVILTF
ncbi:MAG: ANTAR domain-containing protein [Eubacteriales bacterium]|nr:ANTAR domain-containing protein [Eubacteriales bacterium]